MSILEHFDALDGLILNNPFPATAEARGHIAAMRDQIETYNLKAEELTDLEQRYAALQRDHERLQASRPVITAQSCR